MESIEIINDLLRKDKVWWEEIPWNYIAAFFAFNARFLYTKETDLIASKQKALKWFLVT